MSKLFKNTIIYTIGNSLPMAVTFFLLPLYTKYLSPHEYGIVGSMEAVKIFFTILFSLCVERSIVRLYWENDTEIRKKQILGVVFFTLCIISVFGLLLTVLMKNSIQVFFKNINFFPYIFITILISFLSTFEHLPKLYFRLQEKALSFVTLSFLYFFLSTGFIILFVVVNKEGALGYLKGQLIASFLMAIIYLFTSIKISSINFNLKVFKNIFFYSIPFIPPLLVSWFINQSNRVFLENTVSLDAVGIFSFSNKISIATSLFTTALMTSFEPNFYRLASGSDKDRIKIKTFLNFFILIAILSSFIFLLMINEILFVFFDKEYSGTTNIISLITLSNLFGTGTGITGLFFQQSKKMIPNMYISISAAILIFLLYYFLIPIYFIYGAAISLLITTMYAFITSYFYTKYNCFHIKLPLHKYFSIILILTLILFVSNYLYPFFNFYYYLSLKILIIFILISFIYYKFKREFLSVTQNISI
jgi:O-antigen/teichoic acid export membrane protein